MKVLFSQVIKCGDQWYYIDGKENTKGERHVVLSVVQKKVQTALAAESSPTRSTVRIEEKSLPRLLEGLTMATQNISRGEEVTA